MGITGINDMKPAPEDDAGDDLAPDANEPGHTELHPDLAALAHPDGEPIVPDNVDTHPIERS